MLNPARARMLGVQFAGTAVMESEGRQLQVHGGSEADIANGILRVSQGARQLVCFVDGHGEPDPFSMEAHDHLEGTAGHTHGLGAKYVLHERHGMAKARHGLETLNYAVEKVSLVQGTDVLSRCAVLVVAGPKVAAAADGGGVGAQPTLRPAATPSSCSSRSCVPGWSPSSGNTVWCWTTRS